MRGVRNRGAVWGGGWGARVRLPLAAGARGRGCAAVPIAAGGQIAAVVAAGASTAELAPIFGAHRVLAFGSIVE